LVEAENIDPQPFWSLRARELQAYAVDADLASCCCHSAEPQSGSEQSRIAGVSAVDDQCRAVCKSKSHGVHGDRRLHHPQRRSPPNQHIHATGDEGVQFAGQFDTDSLEHFEHGRIDIGEIVTGVSWTMRYSPP